MIQDPPGFRPKNHPPPEFPAKRQPAFARTPPAIFSPMAGLLGLSLALERSLVGLGQPDSLARLVMGLVVGLWVFMAFSYGMKLVRRPAVLAEDLRTVPGRAGLAAGTVGAMLLGSILSFVDPRVAYGAVWVGLGLHAILAVFVVKALWAAPAEGRGVTPAWHLHFVGFIVGGLAAAALGADALATAILWATTPIALGIWAISLWQLIKRIPPAPLRPLLAFHLAPASLFASICGLLGMPFIALIWLGFGAMILLAMILSTRWILASGFSPLWGAFTFPMAAYASALLINGWIVPGAVFTAFLLVANPWIAWRILRMWPGGQLAAKTNAATA
ncbi:MAG: tellurium resistance protein [Rhodobacteraceae bacterium]|nr:tellurium resistance protein [Paracoccaceae bacterium]MCF8516382.1 tellurium resistance protein [Paracoccaceae bacterium]MCF8520732.1 tellurium resistance protein [Paracoccaceae bacterium]